MSVLALFKSMEIREKAPECLTVARKNMEIGSNFTEATNDMWQRIEREPFSPSRNREKKLYDALKTKRDIGIGLICSGMFGIDDAETAYDWILSCLNPEDTRLEIELEVLSGFQNESILFVNEREFFAVGYRIRMYLSTGRRIYFHVVTQVAPFIKFLVKTINETSSDPHPLALLKTEERSYSPQFCPIVVFEDSDLDSALSCFIHNTFKFSGKVLWTPTHLYIQESIYQIAVEKIKDQMPRILELNKRNSVHLKARVGQSLKHSDLEIFQPDPDVCLRLFIGWDPRDCELDIEELPHGIAVLPFRTHKEGLTLANEKSTGHGFGSIWTERLTTARSATKELKLKNIWVNGHGSIVPAFILSAIYSECTGLWDCMGLHESEWPGKSQGLERMRSLPEEELYNVVTALKNESTVWKSVPLWDLVKRPVGTVSEIQTATVISSNFPPTANILYVPEDAEHFDNFLLVLCYNIALRNVVIADHNRLSRLVPRLEKLQKLLPEGVLTLRSNSGSRYYQHVRNAVACTSFMKNLFTSKKNVWYAH